MDARTGFALVAAFAAVACGTGAEARIVCNNGYQKIGGTQMATPYCQDALLAQVAREHGMKATAAHIRENPNYKREVCRFVGSDIRVSEHCLQEMPGIHTGGGH